MTEKSRIWWILTLLMLVGLLLRLNFFLWPPTVLNSDNALYGLMAKHITEGEFPLLTFGQDYMGSLESVVAAPFFMVFGVSIYALKLSPLMFSLFFLAVVYLLGKEIYGPKAALWALAYAAVPPPSLVYWGTSPRGGYSETLFFGTALLWLTVRILRRSGGGRGEWIALGLLAGLGFWTHFLIGYYLLTVAVVLVTGLGRKVFPWAAAAGFAFLLGSLPLWIYNIPRDFASFRLGMVAAGSVSDGFSHLARLEIFELLHLYGKYFEKIPRASRLWFALGGTAYGLLGLFFLARAAKAAAIFLARRSRTPGEGIFLFFLVSFVLLFSSSPLGTMHTVRYALPLFSLIPFIGASCLSRPATRGRPLMLTAWSGLILANLFFLGFDLYHRRPADRITHSTLTAMVDTLDREGENRGIADYWQGERLNFITNERVIFSEPESDHYLPYQLLIESSPRVAFLNRLDLHLAEAFTARGVRFREHRISRFRILTGVEVPFETFASLPLGHRNPPEGAGARWVDGIIGDVGEDILQGRGGEGIDLDLGRSAVPALVRVVLDQRPGERPGEWTIRSSEDGREWQTVLTHASQEPVFVSGPRVYHRGMFLRSELLLDPRPARYLRLQRRRVGGGALSRVEEISVYKAGRAREVSGISEEVVDHLRREDVDFVYADRWESALLGAALGEERSSVPYNFRYHDEDRNGIVELGRRTAFLVPTAEVPPVRAVLTPAAILSEREFGHYTVLLTDLPGRGASGLVWTGFSLLYDGSEGMAFWLYQLGEAARSEGRLGKAEELLRRAVKETPEFFLAQRSLAEVVAEVDPAKGSEMRQRVERMFSPLRPLQANFDAGVTLLGLDIESGGRELRLTYYWVFEEPPGGELWVFAHLNGASVSFQDDFRLSEIGSSQLMRPGNIVKSARRVRLDGTPPGELDLALGLWNPSSHRRVKVLNALSDIRVRSIRLSVAGTSN